jgi:chorismate dehydratase
LSDKIKLGCVDFLNSLPLIYALEKGLVPHSFEIIRDVPSVLVDGLKKGELDIALASTAALPELGEDFSFIPNIGICSDGPVASVCIYFKESIENLKRLYLDPASRTGNLLAQIILKHGYGITPEIISSPESVKPDILKNEEGCVLIGDNALRATFGGGARLDLGAEWKELTGLPFVYALWIGRKENISDEASIALHNSLRIGNSMIEQMIDEQDELPISPENSMGYLKNYIVYDLTEEADAGLGRFLMMSEEFA